MGSIAYSWLEAYPVKGGVVVQGMRLASGSVRHEVNPSHSNGSDWSSQLKFSVGPESHGAEPGLMLEVGLNGPGMVIWVCVKVESK